MEEENKRLELTGVRKEISEMNAEFYQLFYDLKENQEAFGKAHIYDYFLKNLFELYKQEYDRIYLNYEFKMRRERFEKKRKFRRLTPRAWEFLFLHHENTPAKLIIEDVNIKSEEYFRECEGQNDEARPEYMRKLWLTRRDKKNAKKAARRAEKEAKKQARRDKKEARRSKRAARKNGGEQGATAQSNVNAAEIKKQARLRALEESRKQKKREQERAVTSPKSPKTGT